MLPDLKGLKVKRAILVIRGLKEFRGLKVKQEHKAPKDLEVIWGHRGRKERRELLAQLVHKGQRALEAAFGILVLASLELVRLVQFFLVAE